MTEINFNQKTIFNSKIFLSVFYFLTKFLCFILRWKIIGEKPALKKYVVLLGTHTSNWDFVYMMMTVFFYKQPIFWIGKKSLFDSVLSRFFVWCGGLSLGKLQAENTVERCATFIKNSTECALALAPKGTRKLNAEWKTGFYHIAKAANVPIVCAVIDYKRRVSGVIATYYLSNNIQTDISLLKSYYAQYN